MVETDNNDLTTSNQKILLTTTPQQTIQRKSGVVPVKKFPSLQVSHYPVLLCSHNDDEQNQLKSSVIWKASSNSDSPPLDDLAKKTSARVIESGGAIERPLSPSVALPCSPSRLLPPRKLSFSTVVNMKTAAHNNALGSPSIRCQSSASPMTASERQLLWNAVHHDSLKSSMSMESMYNSCTDLDLKFRQQRKRRAGISSGSAAVARGGPFASAGGSGCNSAGYTTGRSQPLGGRSPQSSFDSNSNQDVAQISMNWMRMNGLGTGSIRPFLTGNPTVHPKSSHSSTHLSRVGSLRKMHCVTSLEGQLTRSGTQCDVLNPDNGEIASRKSVSIAYSNDIEGQKNVDDSETPLMEEKEDNSGGRLIKREQLHEKRRITCDRALTFAILGIVLMMLESELRSTNLIDAGSLESLALKACILGSTLVLIVYVGYFHVIDVQLFMNANAADDWRVSLTTNRVSQILVEVCICSVCPLPLELGTFSSVETHNSLHSLNVLFSISMFFRLYWLCRVMLLHSRLFTDASSRSIAGLNRVNFNARFILKTLMTLCPGKMLIVFTASLWIIAGWILRLCEREMSVPRTRELDYGSSIWLVAITFLSVGYGDIVPHTQCGRVMAVITGILGTCTSSMVVAVITRKLELTRAEKHVHSFMMDTQLTKQLKHSAANVLRETWLIYKYRKLVDKADLSKIRQHQRKFLVAIYELRKVKRDQRKLTENLVSLGDVAKTSSSSYELMHDVHSTQEGLSLRITAIEHQLSDISREIGNLAELIRGRRNSMTSEEASPQHRMRLRTIADD